MTMLAATASKRALAGGRPLAGAAPSRQRRALAARPAAVAIKPSNDTFAGDVPPPKRLFSSLAAYADISAALTVFEAATGRAAMVGVAVALGTELVTDRGVFNGLSFHDVTEYLALVGLGVSSAAGVAGAARNPLGLDLRPAVARSLTTLSSADDSSGPGDYIDYALAAISNADLLSACGDEADEES